MAVRQMKDGTWLVEIERHGIPRTRRGGFQSEEAAQIFEQDFIAKKSRIEQPTDKRTLKEIADVWWVSHGINLDDGRKRRRVLLQMADDLKNPIASELQQAQFIGYRYEKTHGQDAISEKAFNSWHEYLDSAFIRLKKLGVIDYESPVGYIDFIKA